MIPDRQRQWTVADRPAGRAIVDGDFALVDAPVARPDAGQLLLGTRYLEFDRKLVGWLRDGVIRPSEHIRHGFGNAPATLRRLFEGRDRGKQLLKVA